MTTIGAHPPRVDLAIHAGEPVEDHMSASAGLATRRPR